MFTAEFVTTVTWSKNPGMQKIPEFRIQVPGGVPKSALRAPKYVDYPTLSAAKVSGNATATGAKGELGSTKGLITADLTVRFDDPQRQWKHEPVSDPSKGPIKLTFQGGKVHLELDLAIYVFEHYKPKYGDKLSAKAFSIIYSHELLHVSDYLDMIGKWFIPELKLGTFADKFLVQGKPFITGGPTDHYQKLAIDAPAFITAQVVKEAKALWNEERNRRQAIRDSGTEYARLNDAIATVYSGANIPKR